MRKGVLMALMFLVVCGTGYARTTEQILRGCFPKSPSQLSSTDRDQYCNYLGMFCVDSYDIGFQGTQPCASAAISLTQALKEGVSTPEMKKVVESMGYLANVCCRIGVKDASRGVYRKQSLLNLIYDKCMKLK